MKEDDQKTRANPSEIIRSLKAEQSTMGGSESKQEEQEKAKEINKNENVEESSGFHIIELNNASMGQGKGISIMWVAFLLVILGTIWWLKKKGKICAKKTVTDNIEMAALRRTGRRDVATSM